MVVYTVVRRVCKSRERGKERGRLHKLCANVGPTHTFYSLFLRGADNFVVFPYLDSVNEGDGGAHVRSVLFGEGEGERERERDHVDVICLIQRRLCLLACLLLVRTDCWSVFYWYQG